MHWREADPCSTYDVRKQLLQFMSPTLHTNFPLAFKSIYAPSWRLQLKYFMTYQSR
ncbi:hypothetical protein EmuJ_000232850 [Echinococcus multilocularis]|uniref:Uncharacterized protein n=1 Tax=Echinococcus multilocularis TaxID=6211 RepID=A0A087W1X0_ECHMU|nr:hypothetical protein EmuJ_000232850 [Echinococcus multilocularis]